MTGWSPVVEVILAVVVAWGWWPIGAVAPWSEAHAGALGGAGLRGAAMGGAGLGGAGLHRGDGSAAGSRLRVVGLGVVAALMSGAGLLAAPVPTVVAAFGAWVVVRTRGQRVRKRTRAREAAALPLALELCQVTLGAGGTVFDCLRVLALDGPEPIRSAAREGVELARAGSRLDTALRCFQERLGLPFQPLTGVLLLGLRQGGSIGLLLQRLTTEANASRRRLGELRARRLPVQLLAPLVLFALPAVVIGAVVPIIVVAVRNLDL